VEHPVFDSRRRTLILKYFQTGMGTSDNNYNAKHENDDDPYYSSTSLPQEYYLEEQ
jgi:hypothetical protein